MYRVMVTVRDLVVVRIRWFSRFGVNLANADISTLAYSPAWTYSIMKTYEKRERTFKRTYLSKFARIWTFKVNLVRNALVKTSLVTFMTFLTIFRFFERYRDDDAIFWSAFVIYFRMGH